MCRIDKLMQVFCKNECVKQKQQVLEVQNGKIFAPTDVIALKQLYFKKIKKDICKETSNRCPINKQEKVQINSYKKT